MSRRSGILLPVASLPSPYGIGDFGPEARRFVDWLAKAGQRVWEVLPLLIPDELGSPFDSPSAFALNWMLVSPDDLVRRGLLSSAIAQRYRSGSSRIRYSRVNVVKRTIIGYAWATFQKKASTAERKRFVKFRRTEQWWLDEYALFMAIKDRQSGKPWWTWPAGLRNRTPSVLQTWKIAHRNEIAYFAFGQWLAREQWDDLKRTANKKGIRILGDLPFSVMLDSVDVWTRRAHFLLQANGAPRIVAAAPPDHFFVHGQSWGNPVYRWETHTREKFRWWVARIRLSLALYDEIRLDHFRGYDAVWTVPTKTKDTKRGHWVRAPGYRLFKKLKRQFPHARLIAEDLGNITKQVLQLRDAFALPGMRILQFGYLPDLLHHNVSGANPRNSAAYTGTHDMPTLTEWMRSASPRERKGLRSFVKDGNVQTWRLLRILAQTRSALVMMPLQDVLGLGKTARLNLPGTVNGKNWTWRFNAGSLTNRVAKKLRLVAKQSGRS